MSITIERFGETYVLTPPSGKRTRLHFGDGSVTDEALLQVLADRQARRDPAPVSIEAESGLSEAERAELLHQRTRETTPTSDHVSRETTTDTDPATHDTDPAPTLEDRIVPSSGRLLKAIPMRPKGPKKAKE